MKPKSDYIPGKDLAALAYMRQSTNTISTATGTYGLPAPTVAALNAALDAFESGITVATNQYELAKSFTVVKDEAKADALAKFRSAVRQIQGNPAITNAQKAEAGLPVHSTSHAPVPSYTPTALVATADVLGNVLLKWNTGANKQGTIYQIQSAPDASGPWTVVESTQRKSFKLSDQPVGETQWFRILATRPRSSSMPSTPVSIWNLGGSVELKVAA